MSGDERPRERPTADSMLSKAESGQSFSEDLNRMSPQEQMSAFREMRNLQSSGKYQNVELIDFNNDGRLDDATVKTANGRTDVYDTPEQLQASQRQADRFLRSAVNGNDISAQYNQLSPQDQARVFAAMKTIIDRPEFASLQLREKDGKLSDIQSTINLGRRGTETRDVYDTAAEARAKEIANRHLPGVIRDIENGNVGRIPQRLPGVIGDEVNKIFRRRKN